MAHSSREWYSAVDPQFSADVLNTGTTAEVATPLAAPDPTDVSREVHGKIHPTPLSSRQAANVESERTIDASAAVPSQYDPSNTQSIRFHFHSDTKTRPDIPLQIELELHPSHPSRSRWKSLILPGMPVPEPVCADALFLSVEVQCKSQPGVNIETCIRCQQVQSRRAANRQAVKASSPPTIQNNLEPLDIQEGAPSLVFFNRTQKRPQICDGRVLISPRVTCYSSHHSAGSGGFELIFTLSDSGGDLVARGRTPPVLIKDVRKKHRTSRMPQREDLVAASSPLGQLSTSIPHQDMGASPFAPPSPIHHHLSPPMSEREGISTVSPPANALPLPYQELVNDFLMLQPQAETRPFPQPVTQTANPASLPLCAVVPVSSHVEPAPRIERINPKSGPVTGGTEVDVFGTGFPFGQGCLFGGNTAPTHWYSDAHCLCFTPPSHVPGPVTVRFGTSVGDSTQYFTYEDSRENDMAVRILKAAGWVLLGGNVDVSTVGTHLFERLGLPPALLGWVGSEPSVQGLFRATDAGPEVAAIEVLKLLDENPRQDSIPIAEAISLASNAGQTALHLSASLGFERLSKELLVRGANPNQRDVNGYTALHFAALYGHIRCAQTLIQGGADGDIITKGGRTAREIALDSDHAAIAQLLGAYVATELDVSGPAVERRDNEHDAPPQELSRPRTGDITSQSDHTGRDVVPTEPQESANNAEDEGCLSAAGATLPGDTHLTPSKQAPHISSSLKHPQNDPGAVCGIFKCRGIICMGIVNFSLLIMLTWRRELGESTWLFCLMLQQYSGTLAYGDGCYAGWSGRCIKEGTEAHDRIWDLLHPAIKDPFSAVLDRRWTWRKPQFNSLVFHSVEGFSGAEKQGTSAIADSLQGLAYFHVAAYQFIMITPIHDQGNKFWGRFKFNSTYKAPRGDLVASFSFDAQDMVHKASSCLRCTDAEYRFCISINLSNYRGKMNGKQDTGRKPCHVYPQRCDCARSYLWECFYFHS